MSLLIFYYAFTFCAWFKHTYNTNINILTKCTIECKYVKGKTRSEIEAGIVNRTKIKFIYLSFLLIYNYYQQFFSIDIIYLSTHTHT